MVDSKGASRGAIMKSEEGLGPRESAVEVAQELREDLETIAESDLPFSHNAQQILQELDQAENRES